ncbi:MAG: glycosyltransferase family 9 protein [Pontibacterium sp.]
MSARKEYKRILVIQWGGLGEAALSSALFEDLHRAYPNAELHLHINHAWLPLFQGDGRFTAVYSQPNGCFSKLAAVLAWRNLLAKQSFDLVIDLSDSLASRWYIAVGRGLGLLPEAVGMREGFPFTLACGPNYPKVHRYTCLQAPFMALNLPHKTGLATFDVPAAEQQAAVDLLSAHSVSPGRFVVMVPGSATANKHKRWSVKDYARLAHLLLARKASKVVILGSSDEREVCQQLALAIGEDAVNLCEQTTLAMIPCIAARAFATVSNSTGLAHIISAAGTPLWVIFGKDVAERDRPLGSHVRSIQVEPHLFNRLPASQAMESLPAERVAQQISESLFGDEAPLYPAWV